MTERPPPEIVPADAKQRKLVLLAVAAILVVSAAALWWLDRRLDVVDRLAEDNLAAAAERARALVGTVVLFAGVVIVGLGMWLFRLGVLINRSGRFPPPGMKVIRDTVVRTDSRARFLANAALVASLLTVLAGTVGMWYVFRLAHALLQVP